jgi:hypothetical protein
VFRWPPAVVIWEYGKAFICGNTAEPPIKGELR